MKSIVRSLLLIVLFCVMVLPTASFAEENDSTENDEMVSRFDRVEQISLNPETSGINISKEELQANNIITTNDVVDDEIEFPDQNLFNALIAQGVDQNSDGAITQDEMKNLTNLCLDFGYNITNLAGMEYATKLISLNLNGIIELTNIEPIKGLTQLEFLDLRGTNVSDADRMGFMRLSDQNCSSGLTTYQVIKPSGLSDAYVVSSSDESVVAATFDNSDWWKDQIKLEARKTGTAKIRVSIGSETKEFTVTVNAPPEDAIMFEDANLLRALIKQGVDQNSDGAITKNEMKNLTQLRLDFGYNNTNLAGMEYATKLTSLNLNGIIELTNIEPIKGLTQLEFLDLRGTKVSDADRMGFMRLSDQTCSSGLTTYQVIKPSGLCDAYVVSSSDESVVAATFDNSDWWKDQIKLEARKTGTAKIRVSIGSETKEFTVTVNAPPEDAIMFEDANLLRALIKQGVDQNGDGAITKNEMKTSEYLDLSKQNLTNLKGLEYAPKLSSIILDGNVELGNIDPIRGLMQLETLDLRGTKVSDADKMSFMRLEDQSCTVGFDKPYIIKPLRLSDSYTINSSDESVVAVSIVSTNGEGQIKLEAKKIGKAQVSVGIGSETKVFAVTVNAQPEGTIQFADQNLVKALVEESVDQNNDGAITQDEMKRYQGLVLNNKGITNLTGLEYATELKTLELFGNTELSNVDPIRGLTQLDLLDLGNTAISDADKMSFLRLSDRTCSEGSLTFQVLKPKGISHEYTVSSSDETVVIATIDNLEGEARIKYEPQKVGTAEIRVSIGSESKTFTTTVKTPPEGVIQFEDDNLLYGLFISDVDINNDGAITKEELKKQKRIDLSRKNITNLTGMEFATELSSLFLDGNPELDNIEPIKDLTKLYALFLVGTNVSDADKMSLMRLPDQTCSMGFTTNCNIQPYGLSEEYTVSSSDETIVAASIDHTSWPERIILDPKKIGTAQIRFSFGTETKAFTVTVKDPAENGIRFEDANLLNYMLTTGVDHNHDGVISQEEIKQYSSFYLDNQNITSLTGLEYATGLEYLSLTGNPELSNVDPIKGLTKLNEIHLTGTKVSDADKMSFVRLSDQTGTAGSTMYQPILPSGLSEKYTVSTSDESVVVATIDNSSGIGTIKLDSIKNGTAQIRVSIGTETKAFTWTVVSAMTEPKLGDVDGNGQVLAYDALLTLQIATGKKQGNTEEIKAADIDNSGSVQAYDALRILQFATGKITVF